MSLAQELSPALYFAPMAPQAALSASLIPLLNPGERWAKVLYSCGPMTRISGCAAAGTGAAMSVVGGVPEVLFTAVAEALTFPAAPAVCPLC